MHGVTRETVRQWTIAGCPRLSDGTYIAAETITWRIQREIQLARPAKAEGEKPQSEMNRKLAAEADLKELQLAQLRGELVTVESHTEAVAKIAGGFAAVASGQLARFERRIVQATTPADARIITQDIHRALMEGAQGLAEDLEDDASAQEEAA